MTSVRLMKIRQDIVGHGSNLFYALVIWDSNDHRRFGADIGLLSMARDRVEGLLPGISLNFSTVYRTLSSIFYESVYCYATTGAEGFV